MPALAAVSPTKAPAPIATRRKLDRPGFSFVAFIATRRSVDRPDIAFAAFSESLKASRSRSKRLFEKIIISSPSAERVATIS
jgi:hypothetical protein